jgi:hypothetical protein
MDVLNPATMVASTILMATAMIMCLATVYAVRFVFEHVFGVIFIVVLCIAISMMTASYCTNKPHACDMDSVTDGIEYLVSQTHGQTSQLFSVIRQIIRGATKQ